MILWFMALSFAMVLIVFDSAALDYRLIMVGALVPWMNFLWGDPWFMYSVFFPVFVMTVVMTVGWGRRLVQRRWLGLPIGMFLHGVLAGTWANQALFWWPAFGVDLEGTRPAVAGLGLAVVLELAGVGVAFWLWRFLGMRERRRRRRFLRTGHVDRTLLR